MIDVLKNKIRKSLQKLIFKIISFKDFNDWIQENTHESNSLKCILGEGTKFFTGSSIVNMRYNQESIVIGLNTLIKGEILNFPYGGEIRIGDSCYIGDNTRIWSAEKITIGSRVMISHNCNIMDTNTHHLDAKLRAEELKVIFDGSYPQSKGDIITKPIIIEDDVWISFNVSILKGVKIGKGAIIGANAIITKDVEAYTIVFSKTEKEIKRMDSFTNL